ncbi:MAG: hypothetical protein NXI30_04680 [bacterium]|nr:hypothetical protein [bacterium]
MRRLLDQGVTPELISQLTPEQVALLDGDKTFSDALAAKVLAAALSASTPAQLEAFTRLILAAEGRVPDDVLSDDRLMSDQIREARMRAMAPPPTVEISSTFDEAPTVAAEPVRKRASSTRRPSRMGRSTRKKALRR